MPDLTMIYITADPQDGAAELRCTDHPEWWADADGTDLPSAVRTARGHFRDEHRAHVTDCMCSGTQVIDQRCIPDVAVTVPNPSGGTS
jgi:hypothetical protein